jgi:sugar lactone lactonase YvrE
MKRISLLVATLALLVGAAPAFGQPFPDEIDLPSGFFPEGIAVGKGTSFYVGSLANGSVYKGDLSTGEGEELVAPFGPFTTVGIEVDGMERIWVAGGPSGTGRVYDGRTGAELAVFAFTAPFASFINDVVVTNDAAYFTDSGTTNDPDPGVFQFAGEPRIFEVPLGPGQSLPGPSEFNEIDVDAPDVAFPNLNGIETTPGGGALIVGHTVGQVLFAVDPATGSAELIDIGGVPLIGNDGLVRRGNVVYVVENAISQITAVKVAPDGSSGEVVATYAVPGAETPTTAGIFGNALYAVDARFDSMDDPYRVYRVDLN